MEIFNSREDLRVVIRTPTASVIDTHVTALEVEDALGRFTVVADGEPALAALVPTELVLRKRDGGEIRVEVGWGSLTAVGHQARIVVDSAKVRYIEPLRIAV
jgi:F0F1-type ATP synthase epsilon subunit